MQTPDWRRLMLLALAVVLAACEQATAAPAPRRSFPTPLPASTPFSAAPLPDMVTPVPAAFAAAPLPDGWQAWLGAHAHSLPVDPSTGAGDLSALKEVIGDARVVVIGEPSHGVHEFAQWRTRLLSLLVGELGFSLVVIDAPWGDVTPLNDYVVNARGDPQRLLGQLTRGWNSDETLSMLNWLNTTNRMARGAGPARLAGMQAGLPSAAMDAVEDFLLKRGDAAALREARNRFACLRPYARIGSGYSNLPAQVTSDCRAALQAVLDDMRANESYRADPDALAQALIGARVVLQSEDLLLLGGGPDAGAIDSRYAAENVLAQLETGARAVVWARTAQADQSAVGPKSVAALLRDKLGNDVRSVAFSMQRGRFVATPGVVETADIRNTTAPPSDAYEYAFAEGIGQPFWLSLRDPALVDPAARWLANPRLFRAISPAYNESQPATHFAPADLPRAFDAVFFVPEVSPALTVYSGVALLSPFGPPRNLDIEQDIDGWAAFGVLPPGYAFAADRDAPAQGARSLRLAFSGAAAAPAGRGMVGQTINALRYRGQRLRISALLRTQAVESGAGLMAVLVPLRAATFALTVRDTMEGRAVRGTTDWTRQSIVVDLPSTEMSLALGVWLDGRGTVWIDDVQIETVGPDVPVTYALGLPAEPRNLGFASGMDGWALDANRRGDWSFGTAVDERTGGQAARLASAVPAPGGVATVQQLLNASPYRGRRVRLSGDLRSAAINGRGTLTLGASSQRMVWNAPNPARLSGTAGWTPLSVWFDVPDTAEMLHLQISLDSAGQFWLSNLRFEVASP